MRNRLQAVWQHLKTENTSPARLAASVFTGLFLGVVPLYGIQTGLCLFVAWLFRLNKLTVIGAAQISFPIFAPFLVSAGIVIGEFVRFGELRPIDLEQAQSFLSGLALFSGKFPDLFLSCLIGDTILGAVLGILGAAVAYRVASREGPQATDIASP